MGAPNERQPRAVAVLAFKAVYTLETKRRENDKRVLALYVEYVVLNFDRALPSNEFQNERHDDGSRTVRFHVFNSHLFP